MQVHGSNLLSMRVGIFIALASLVLIFKDILDLELSHALNLIQVDDEAFIISMQRLDALSAEYCQMIWTVEVLYALMMLLTYFVWETLLIFFVKVKTGLGENGVFRDDFVENVNV